ncbi:MAG: hypothetical protein HUK15_03855, partial [Bacteroidales bacterium]|nr:hypothetical protein [Bacteroidales bacterium]
MKGNFTLIAALLLFCNVVLAQTDVKFSASNFPGRSADLSAAKAQIKNGDVFLASGDINNALRAYLLAQDFNPDNSELNFKIGCCYFGHIQKFKCLEYFEKAYNLNKAVDKKILFYLGCGYHWNYQFDEAKKCFTRYISAVKDKDEIQMVRRLIDQCRNGSQLMQDTVDVEIINLGKNINSEYRE